jgi:hypothetical protein
MRREMTSSRLSPQVALEADRDASVESTRVEHRDGEGPLAVLRAVNHPLLDEAVTERRHCRHLLLQARSDVARAMGPKAECSHRVHSFSRGVSVSVHRAPFPRLITAAVRTADGDKRDLGSPST